MAAPDPATARAAVYEGPGRLIVRDFPLPELGPGDMLVAVELAGVDGSEVHMFRGEIAAIDAIAPVVFGDEILGRVQAIGAQAAARRGLKPGDRVVVEARWPCADCRPCREGNYYLCDHRWEKGGYGWMRADAPPHLWGGYATHVFVPADALVYPVDADLPAETALVACSVLANSIYWTRTAGIGLGDPVAVIGPGPQGIGAALVAQLRGADVVLAGLPRDAARLALARDLGVTRTVVLDGGDGAAQLRVALGQDPAVVIETAGAQPAKDLALAAVRTGGRVVNCSVPPGPLSVDFTAVLLKQVTMQSPLAHPHTVPEALRLGQVLRARGQDVGRMVSHVFALDQAEEAVRTAGYETPESPVKVAIRP